MSACAICDERTQVLMLFKKSQKGFDCLINWILGGIIVAAMFFAVRYSLVKAHKGGCAGCSGCSGGQMNSCCHANQEKQSS